MADLLKCVGELSLPARARTPASVSDIFGKRARIARMGEKLRELSLPEEKAICGCCVGFYALKRDAAASDIIRAKPNIPIAAAHLSLLMKWNARWGRSRIPFCEGALDLNACFIKPFSTRLVLHWNFMPDGIEADIEEATSRYKFARGDLLILSR